MFVMVVKYGLYQTKWIELEWSLILEVDTIQTTTTCSLSSQTVKLPSQSSLAVQLVHCASNTNGRLSCKSLSQQ